jgi:hypothetical protein
MNLYRSLEFNRPPDESFLMILEWLAREGYLQNNRRLDVQLHWSRSSRFVELICSMKNLEKLDMCGYDLTPEVLAHVFRSCFKLTELHIGTKKCETLDMDEHLKKSTKTRFQEASTPSS